MEARNSFSFNNSSSASMYRRRSSGSESSIPTTSRHGIWVEVQDPMVPFSNAEILQEHNSKYYSNSWELTQDMQFFAVDKIEEDIPFLEADHNRDSCLIDQVHQDDQECSDQGDSDSLMEDGAFHAEHITNAAEEIGHDEESEEEVGRIKEDDEGLEQVSSSQPQFSTKPRPGAVTCTTPNERVSNPEDPAFSQQHTEEDTSDDCDHSQDQDIVESTSHAHTAASNSSNSAESSFLTRPFALTPPVISSVNNLYSLNNRNTQRQLVRSGWLFKQREVLKSWNRRYFVLLKRTNLQSGSISASFQYYKSTNFSKLRGEIQLQDGPVWIRFLQNHESKRPFCFEVCQGDYSMVCQGTDQDDVNGWVHHLQSLNSDVRRMAESSSTNSSHTDRRRPNSSNRPPVYSTSTQRTIGKNKIEASPLSNASSSYKTRPQAIISHLESTRKKPYSTSNTLSDSKVVDRVKTKRERANRTRESNIMAEVRRIFQAPKSRDAMKCRSFVKSIDFQNKSHDDPVKRIREFHGEMVESVLREHGTRLVRLQQTSSSFNMDSTTSVLRKVASDIIQMKEFKELESVIRYCTRVYLEELIYLPLFDGLQSHLRQEYQEEDISINRKLRWLQGKDQAHFHIPNSIKSPTGWRKSWRLLSRIISHTLPTLKYEVLVATIHDIQAAYHRQHEVPVDLEPDELLPVLTYVIVHSGLDNLMSLKVLLTEFSTPNATQTGNPGDDLALHLFTAAVEIIKTVRIPAVLEDIFRDPVAISIDADWCRYFDFEPEKTYRYGAAIHEVTMHGMTAFGLSVTHGHILVTVNGQNVVLWPYQDIINFLQVTTPPYRLSFISSADYFKILTTTKSLWNVALMYACQRGDIASVQMLLANGAEVNYVAHECGGNSPLHVAVSALHFNVVSYLLQHGARVNAIGEYGRSALHMVGAPCVMPCSYWEIPDRYDWRDSNFSSSYSRTASSVDTFVSTPTTQKSANSVPHYKFNERIILTIRKLLNHGASLDQVDLYGNTILMLLADKGCLGGIDVVMEADSAFALNAQNWVHGMSALTLAAMQGQYEIVEALLDYGAFVDLRTLHGESALHFAAANANRSICEILIEKGATGNAQTNEGLTPLMVAVSKGHSVSLFEHFNFRDRRLLLPSLQRRGASSVPYTAAITNGTNFFTDNSVDESQLATPNVQADDHRVMETVEYLLDQHANTEFVNRQYRTSLHYAAMYGDNTIYEFLRGQFERHRESGQFSVDFHDIPDINGYSATSFLQEREEEVHPEMEGFIYEERDGEKELVAGSLESLVRAIFQSQHTNWEEIATIVQFCDDCCQFGALLALLRAHLTTIDSIDSTDTLAYNNNGGRTTPLFSLRIILNILDMIIHSVRHQQVMDLEVCETVCRIMSQIFVMMGEQDRQCMQWLRCYSILPGFLDACRSGRLYEFQWQSSCGLQYAELMDLLKEAKKQDPTLMFIEEENEDQNEGSCKIKVEKEVLEGAFPKSDSLLTTTMDVSDPTMNMRHRLCIAGVWTGLEGQAAENFSSPDTIGKRLNCDNHKTNFLVKGLSNERARLWILELDAMIFAQQITLLQHCLFSRIKLSEFLASKRDATKTPFYDRLRKLHNHITTWIVSHILTYEDVDQRAQLLAYYIKVAAICLSPIQNFDGFMAIMNATNDTSIFRLQKTWGRLLPQSRELWHELKKHTENAGRTLNKALREASPPSVPYIGVVIQNIVVSQEYPDFVEENLVNLKKSRQRKAIVSTLSKHQQVPYLFQVENRVIEHLCSRPNFGDQDSAFQRSLVLEPRVTKRQVQDAKNLIVHESSQKPFENQNPFMRRNAAHK
uniref:Rasspecific guanine nucleotidereleasing factor putat n=1 Tax=Albugo laibachii Nc14 TaxID=890382 RepID=F0WSH1_9STRA|nr:rasspecific guanine nucleotidereleasing factor putat [Albugo laibachii Nc14]|eukprot:CCA24293.1 rasspecific guanine nucleotidereleasing factor putat [Albugo laibachii Nc14]